jgi:hypothetical protein
VRPHGLQAATRAQPPPLTPCARHSDICYATSTIHMDVCCARAPPLTTTPTTALYHLTISAYEGRGFTIDTMDFAAAREKGGWGRGGGAAETTQPSMLPPTPCHPCRLLHPRPHASLLPTGHQIPAATREEQGGVGVGDRDHLASEADTHTSPACGPPNMPPRRQPMPSPHHCHQC